MDELEIALLPFECIWEFVSLLRHVYTRVMLFAISLLHTVHKRNEAKKKTYRTPYGAERYALMPSIFH